MQMAQAPSAVAGGTAATSPATAAAAAAHAAAAAAATPIMLAPRPPHTAVQAATPTAATPRRRYDEQKCSKKDPDLRVLGEIGRLKAEFKKDIKKIVCYVYRQAILFKRVLKI